MTDHIEHLSRVDKKLAKVIAKVGPFTLKPKRGDETFPALVRSIVYQQLTGKAASTIHARLKALLPTGTGNPRPEDILALPTEALRGAGLSGAKARYLQDLSRKTIEGLVPSRAQLRRLTDDEIILRLTEVEGIGQWSVEMFLMFTLGRLDVLPATDLGIRKGFAKTYKLVELPKPREIMEYGERWRPFRTVASWYMWRCLENGDGQGA